MMLSAFAYAIGVIELLIGLPLLFDSAAAARVLIRFVQEDLLYRTIGAFLLILSVLVLAGGMAVDASVAGLVRAAAWLTAVKCLIICWRPQWHSRLAERFLGRPPVQRFVGAIAVAAGLLFFWAGVVLE